MLCCKVIGLSIVKRGNTMDILGLVFYPAGIGIGCLIAFQKVRTKEVKKEIKYGVIDKISQILNVILCLVYGVAVTVPMRLGTGIQPADGATLFQSFLAFILSAMIAAAPIYAFACIGMSVDYRRRGHGIIGFFVQFLGAAGIYLPISLFELVEKWNIAWLVINSN